MIICKVDYGFEEVKCITVGHLLLLEDNISNVSH